MKINRKGLLLLGCIVVIVAGSLFGTLAYLTDSEAATNTFTVGQVGLTLDEAKVDELGQPDGDKRWKPTASDPEQEYHLIPGYTYTKDPTLHVSNNSSDCYLFVKVDNALADVEGGKTIAAQMAEKGWTLVTGETDIYAYNAICTANQNVAVFESFTIDGSVNNTTIAEYEGKSITVTGYAVQAAGFEAASPAEIWNTALADKA